MTGKMIVKVEKQDVVVWKMVIEVWWHWFSSVGL